MDILYDHQMFSIQKYGGISRIFIELMRELSSQPDCCIHWHRGLKTDDYDIKEFAKNLKRYWGFEYGWLKKIPDFNRFSLQAFVRSNLKAYDIYHPTYYDASLLEIVKPKKLVSTIHDMILEKFLGNLERFQKQIKDKEYLIKKSDLIFVNSLHTKKDLLEFFNLESNKIILTPWATRINSINPVDLPKICLEKPYFLYVGTRSKYKNFEILMQAFAADKFLANNFNLVCFGGSGEFLKPEIEFLEKNKLRENFIYLRGDDSLLKSLYTNAVGLVYTSRYEGFGLPPLEAMTCSCPVICCPTSSLPEVVGEAAIFFHPDSVEELVASLKLVVEDRQVRERLLEKGQERARLFSWEKTALLTLEGYKQL